MGYQHNVTVETVIQCIFITAKLHIFRLNEIKILILTIL